MRKFLIALQFLTIIPVRARDINEKDFAKSTIFFPVVGIIIGILLAVFNLVLSEIMPQIPTSCFLLIFWVFITGALHLDGLADTIDGFYASTNREEILRVMEDTSTGAKGVAAVVMLLLFKFVLLLSVEDTIKIFALILIPAISRYSMVMAMVSSNPTRKEGIGRLFIGTTGWAGVIISSFIIVALVYFSSFFLPFKILGFIGLAVAVIVTLAFVRYCNYKIGGMTGDTLGALNEIVEVATLLAIVVVSFTREI